MERRTFLKKLAGWLAAILVFAGLGGLAYRLFGEDEAVPEETADHDLEVGEDRAEDKEEKKEKEEEKNDTDPEEDAKMIPRRTLGKTGYAVSLFSLGGEATVEQAGRVEEAEAIINRAIDSGVNYIDTAPTYGGGGSENNIGRVMDYRRNEVFLATKTGDRSYDGTMRLIEQSLDRLRTDHIDLYQLHNVRTEEDLKRIFAGNGAIKALEKLKDEGVISYTGITGHKDPDVLLQGIREYPFDCLLMSLNAGDIHYMPFQEKLLLEAVEKEMGIIAMKVTARKQIFREDGLPAMKQALDYVFSFPISTAIIGISNESEVDENARIAKEFEKLPEDEIKRLEELVKPYEQEANFFKYRW